MMGWGGSSSCYPKGFKQEEECTTPKKNEWGEITTRIAVE
jgi:hypothetical protein